jgi:hypothetical protein
MPALDPLRVRSAETGVTRPAKSRDGAKLPDARSADPLAGLAHNLRNLTQVVNGNLELIAARTDDELALRYLANAKLAAQLITELAQGLDDTQSE